MNVAIRLINGKDIFIEDAYKVSAKPDDFFVRISHYKGDVIINRNEITLIESSYGMDSNKEDNKDEIK